MGGHTQQGLPKDLKRQGQEHGKNEEDSVKDGGEPAAEIAPAVLAAHDPAESVQKVVYAAGGRPHSGGGGYRDDGNHIGGVKIVKEVFHQGQHGLRQNVGEDVEEVVRPHGKVTEQRKYQRR